MLELRQGPDPINKRRRSKTEPPPRPGVSLPPHKPHRSRDPWRAGLPTPSQSTGGGGPTIPRGDDTGAVTPRGRVPGPVGDTSESRRLVAGDAAHRAARPRVLRLALGHAVRQLPGAGCLCSGPEEPARSLLHHQRPLLDGGGGRKTQKKTTKNTKKKKRAGRNWLSAVLVRHPPALSCVCALRSFALG